MARSLQETGLWVKRLQVQHQRAANDALHRLGLTIVQWDALRHFAAHPGASLHDLAVLTFQTDQSMGALAGRLVARGLLRRVSGPGRAVRHELTAAGTALFQEAADLMDVVLAASFEPLSAAELATFDELLRRLVR